MREAAQIALAADWSLEEAAALVGAADVALALGQFEAGMVPLARPSRSSTATGAALVRKWLKPIGHEDRAGDGREVAGGTG
jgi:hypothetical protein